jgi:hypothetical protein
MAKLSISVPDDLWQKATALADEGTPSSQVVQAALTEWAQRRGPALENAFEPDRRRLHEVATKLGVAYEEEFRRGYDDGLKIAEWAGFDAVSVYIRLRDWEMFYDATPTEEHVREDGTTTLVTSGDPVPSFWDAVGLDKDWPAEEVYADGAARAFRDLWETLREGGWRAESSDVSEGIE